MSFKKKIIRLFLNQRKKAYCANLENIKKCILAYSRPNISFCDLGCDDGEWAFQLAKQIHTTNIYGVEIVDSRRKLAIEKGIVTETANLNCEIPYGDSSLDLIHSNQVIEHLSNTDKFASEIYRILKPVFYFQRG